MQLDRHRFQLIGCNVLAFQGEHLADQDGAEDQHESHDQLEPHLLTVQKHAEQHAEHRFGQGNGARTLKRSFFTIK